MSHPLALVPFVPTSTFNTSDFLVYFQIDKAQDVQISADKKYLLVTIDSQRVKIQIDPSYHVAFFFVTYLKIIFFPNNLKLSFEICADIV